MYFRHIFTLCLTLGTIAFATSGTAQTSPQNLEDRLRAVLAETPDNDQIRERLAVLLLNSGRAGEASYHARFLSRNAKSHTLRADAARLHHRIEGPSWGWRPLLSFAPSSNLNKGSTQSTIYVGDAAFTIDPDSRAKDGIGLTFGASFWTKWRPGETWYAHWSNEATTTIYDNPEMETRQNLRTQLSFSRRLKNGTLNLSGSFDAAFERGKLERRTMGPAITRDWHVSDKRRFRARLELLDVHYPNEIFRSGHRANLTLGWTEVLSPSLTLNVNLPLEVNRTGRDYLDYDGVGVTASITKAWGNSPWRTTFGLGYREDSYKGDFPGSTVRRKDQITTVSIGQSNTDWSFNGFVPQLRYVYSDSRSNVSLYDYDSHDIQVTFQKKF